MGLGSARGKVKKSAISRNKWPGFGCFGILVPLKKGVFIPTPSLFEELKSATRPSHDRLESQLDLLSPDLTREDYIEVLKRFYGVYLAIEPLVMNSELKDFYADRKKLPLLTDDLLNLGLNSEELGGIDALSIEDQPRTLAELLGTLYVLEGSTLGGQILKLHFGPRFNLTPLNGLSFFCSYGPTTMTMWKNWRAISERIYEEKCLDRSEIIDHANKTFSALSKWMCSRSI